MDVWTMIQITAAVFVGNAAFAMFGFAIYVTWRLQKDEGRSDTELPLWVYPCAIVPLALAAIGFYLIPV